ncbi:MAG: peptidase A24 [Acidobacteria bacterium]|nr:MAG: peptidase A24 [Acidobacteriota bacterium]
MGTISSPAFVTLAVGVTLASAIDIRTRRIPNVLTALMSAAGIALAATGASGISVGFAALGLVVGLLVMLPGHALGATGAGDVKLMAAIGAIVGPGMAVNAFLFTALTGGLLALGVAVLRGRLAATVAGTRALVTAPAEARQAIEAPARGNRFAYGPAIAIGSMLAVIFR